MKKLLSLALAGVMALSLAACGSTPSSTPASTPASEPASASTPASEPAEEFETVDLRVAYMPNMGSNSLLATALNMGYFEEMGLNVTLTEFQGGPAEIAAMASGDIDISQIGHGAHALCIEGQAKIFHLDCTSLADAVVANTEKGINSIADLKGKTIGVSSGTSAEIILNLALASAGLTQDDVTLTEMDANGMVTAMVSGGVDACATWSPSTMTIANALGDKALTLATNNDYVDQVTFPSSFITTEKFANENHDVLVRFSRALLKAQDYRAANIEEVAKWVAKQCKADEQTMLDCVGEGNWLTGEFVANGLTDGTVKSYYENQQKVFIDAGRITEEVPVEDYVLFDVMQEAVDATYGA
ncbi:MAG TPA: ABC transporter substrate-binding protein [Candidatus Fournierella merdipullorum]|uniref:ABC transporter substrate-binding protein n=1 Tax=Candidatus Allofournierella merdipullorum TaxID=2838595 RepID=A0A9D2E4K5_9FIRM|nr:ABC transporter substrate-binding protein [Candidatus Fournierella merdipullorum]